MRADFTSRTAPRPNIIIFLTDQQRWDTTGVHGNPLDLTPTFDWMASRGTHFATTCTCQPVCGPARASIQTGCYATRTGVFRNGIALGDHLPTIAERLAQGGYETAYIGKWHLAAQNPVPRAARHGYDFWLGSNALEHTSQPYSTTVYDTENRPVSLPGYRVDALVDAAIRYVADTHTKPYLLFVSLLEPHHQNHLDDYPPPVGYRERFAGRWTPPDLAALGGSAPQHLGGYWGMVKRIDEALGRLLDALRSLQAMENTVLLFSSDHGNHFKTRNDEYKRSGHEASIRVPFAAIGPGFWGGGRVERLVSLLDIAPTVLDCAGVAAEPPMDGRSLLELVHNRSTPWREELFVQISESEVGRAVRTERWKYGVVAPGADGLAEASATAYEERYLFDLFSDPYELTNLIGMTAYSGVADGLRSRLEAWLRDVEGQSASIRRAEERPSGQRSILDSDRRL